MRFRILVCLLVLGCKESPPSSRVTAIPVPDPQPSAFPASQTSPSEDAAPAPGTPRIVELGVNEAHLYPRREDVAIEGIEEIEAGVLLTLASDMPRFSHFLTALGPMNEGPAPVGEERVVRDHRVKIDLGARGAEEEQTRTVTVWAVDDLGRRSTAHSLQLTYYSPALYARNDRASIGIIAVDYSDMPEVDGRVGDWIADQPSADDIAFAHATWGSIVARERTSAAKARALAVAILDALDPYRGIPSDWMQDAPPFDQYRRVIAGGDHVWCDNFAKIFVRAAVSFGIPARLIEMPGKGSNPGEGLSVLWVDGHTTTEIFDEDENRWIWIDLTFSILRAETDGLGPLQVASLHRHLVDPNARQEIVIDRYDAKQHTVVTDRVPVPDARHAMMRFFNRGQRYQYYAR